MLRTVVCNGLNPIFVKLWLSFWSAKITYIFCVEIVHWQKNKNLYQIQYTNVIKNKICIVISKIITQWY